MEPNDLDRFQKYQLYGTDILKKIRSKSEGSLTRNSFFQDASTNVLEPVGGQSVVSFNNGFIYEDVRSMHQDNMTTFNCDQNRGKKRTKYKNSLENLI